AAGKNDEVQAVLRPAPDIHSSQAHSSWTQSRLLERCRASGPRPGTHRPRGSRQSHVPFDPPLTTAAASRSPWSIVRGACGGGGGAVEAALDTSLRCNVLCDVKQSPLATMKDLDQALAEISAIRTQMA